MKTPIIPRHIIIMVEGSEIYFMYAGQILNFSLVEDAETWCEKRSFTSSICTVREANG